MGLAALLLVPYWLVQGLRHGKYISKPWGTPGVHFSRARQAACAFRGCDMDSCCECRRGAFQHYSCAAVEGSLPHRALILSTTTNTGQALARERMPFADAVIYYPLDWAFCVRRALDAVRPSAVLVLETEIWPNFLREAGRRQDSRTFRQRTHF